MSVKRTGQFSFVEALVPHGLGAHAQLDRLSALVSRDRFEALLAGLRDQGPGRPGHPPLLMFKALLLQSLHGLSDAQLGAVLIDRLSFRRFVGLGLAEAVPDHGTLCRPRNGLREAGLLERLFGELDRQLEGAGLVLVRGTMVDATLIETGAARPGSPERPGSPKRPSPERPSADPGAGGTRRGRAFTFGTKAHVGVDEGSGLIRAVVTTPDNVNDTGPADGPIRGDEGAVYGDGATPTPASGRSRSGASRPARCGGPTSTTRCSRLG